MDVELTLSNDDCEVLGFMTVSWAPTHLCVTDTHVVAASKGSVLVWGDQHRYDSTLRSQNDARIRMVCWTGCMVIMMSSAD